MTKIKFSFTSAAPQVFMIVSASLFKVWWWGGTYPKGAQGLWCLHAAASCLTACSSQCSALTPPAVVLPVLQSVGHPVTPGKKAAFHSAIKGKKMFP